MVVGIKMQGNIGDIYTRLQVEAWLCKGITVLEYARKEHVKHIEKIEMKQFGSEEKNEREKGHQFIGCKSNV